MTNIDSAEHIKWVLHMAKFLHDLCMVTLNQPHATLSAFDTISYEDLERNPPNINTSKTGKPSNAEPLPTVGFKKQQQTKKINKYQTLDDPAENLENLFPDGTTSFLLSKDGDDSIPVFGWKFMTHNKKKLKYGSCVYKICLGVFKCPKCEFVRPPIQPKSKNKHAIPPAPKEKCPLHMEDDLVHISCSCSMTIIDIGDNWQVNHLGKHNHQRPPWTGKLDKTSQKKLEAFIMSNTDVTPSQLRMGNVMRNPASEIHSSLGNMDKLKHERNKVLKKYNAKTQSSLANFINFGGEAPLNFLRAHDLLGTNPHIIFMDDEMEKLLLEANTCLETDSVEGFIEEPAIKKNINVTFTSGYDALLDRWVPLCISILFGKTEADYKNHCKEVFKSYKVGSWKEFKTLFPGNVCDMSDALRKSFFSTMKDHCTSFFGQVPTQDEIGHMYGVCKVHFERSRRRVATNRSVVSIDKEDYFNQIVKEICATPQG